MAATISPEARNYGEHVLGLARSDGYINPAMHVNAPAHLGYGGDCCICCCPCSCYGGGGREDGKAWLVAGAIAAAAISLVSLGFTAKAAFQASSYAREKREANEELDNNPGGNNAASTEVYKNAKNLLNGMVSERSWTTVALSAVTIGTILLTVACIIALVTQPHFGAYAHQIHQYALYGGLLAGTGLIGFALVQGYYSGYKLNEDANKLRESIDSPQPEIASPHHQERVFPGRGFRLGKEQEDEPRSPQIEGQ